MSRPVEIGASSAEALGRVRAAVTEFAAWEVPETRPVFAEMFERLDAASLRISVVGQVKAGKSSLINALTGLRNLLPTEVNPWTAVITNLHFGHPDRAHGSGEFELFSQQEWNRMLEGGSESRKLAEQYLPGFKSEVLTRQIGEMQAKARARLGEMYLLLLGKTHRFNTVTPEVLERYVSAGYADNDMKRSTAGRFSGICKSAHVYLDAGPFRVPTTVSDTPGINDPFLVRDEITTSSFRDADIFVVTLSAHQVMNPADIALLKMLSHHERQTVVVFVNRVDELDTPGESTGPLVAALSERLRAEIGDSGHVVLAGSAEWGRIAVTGSDAEVAAVVATEGYRDLARAMDVATEIDPREGLLAVSGLGPLAAVLSEIALAGRTRDMLAEASTSALTGLDFLREGLIERLSHDTAVPTDADPQMLAAAEGARIDARLVELAALSRMIVGLTDDFRDRLDSYCAQATSGVMRAIRIAIDGFVDEQVAGFRAALDAGGDAARWSFDTLALQEKARAQVLDSYRAGRDELDTLLRNYASRLNLSLAPVVGALPLERILGSLPMADVVPGFAPKSNLVEVELSANRGWKFWKSRRLKPEEAGERIARVIRAEMLPAVDTLDKAISWALATRNTTATGRLQALLDHARTLVEAETADLERDAELVGEGLDAAGVARLLAERARRTEILRDKIERIELACIGLAAESPAPARPPVAAPAVEEV